MSDQPPSIFDIQTHEELRFICGAYRTAQDVGRIAAHNVIAEFIKDEPEAARALGLNKRVA